MVHWPHGFNNPLSCVTGWTNWMPVYHAACGICSVAAPAVRTPFGADTQGFCFSRMPEEQFSHIQHRADTKSRPIYTGYVSAALRHASGADRFHFNLCDNFHQVRCAAFLLCPSSGSPEPSGTDTQDFYFWRMLDHDRAIHLNLAPSRSQARNTPC